MSVIQNVFSPNSCDTFVVMCDKTKGGHVIFGKNSDRPQHEVQEVIYRPACTYEENSKLKCTYIEIDQASCTYAVILSKPVWMWGAEMGANEYGVCVGNEAIWTKLEVDSTERLLGMDLVRLSLERGRSAKEALDVICSLLDIYGQGGNCSNTDEFSYHNSFMIVDSSEAWILETAGNMWAAERVTSGFRNISNCLTIGTKIDAMSDGLKEKIKDLGFWDGKSDFSFSGALSEGDEDRSRLSYGENLLNTFSSEDKFTLSNMFEILRNTESNICRSVEHGFPTMGSMVSVIVPESSVPRPHCHWLTGTPNPKLSVFKPFIFTPNVKISPFIHSKEDNKTVQTHVLYRRHTAAMSNETTSLLETLKCLEDKCVVETEEFLSNFSEDRLKEVDDLFKDCVESELKFYIN